MQNVLARKLPSDNLKPGGCQNAEIGMCFCVKCISDAQNFLSNYS